jgi:hypothetical protein
MVQYFVGPIITLHGSITKTEYVDRLGNLVYPKIQTSFPNNNAVFQDDNVPIHTAGTVQSLFEEHFPWPAQSSDFNIIEPLWPVLETRVRNRLPPSTSVKQLEHVIQEEWCKIRLETVQNLHKSIQRRTAAVL